MAARTLPGRSWLLILAGAGALLSALLEVVHYRAYAAPGEASLCAFGARFDCASVALSKHAVLWGVPLPLWGCIGFGALAWCAWASSRWLLPLAAVAIVAGLVLSGVSAWGVGAWCIACEIVHALSAAILALAWRARHAFERPFAAPDALRLGLPVLGLLLALRGWVPHYWQVFTWHSAPPFAHGRTEHGDPWIGAEQPKLTLEEFVDYTCPHCRVASSRSLARLAAHPTELRIVRRLHPRIACQPRAETRCLPLRIAFCADEQDHFWQADRWLFEHSMAGDIPDVDQAAQDLGLDPLRLRACVTSELTWQRAVAEWRRAKQRRLPGTPYYATEDRLVSAAAARALIDAL